MNIRLNNLIMFVVGAAAGSVVTWKLLKTKYEQIAQEEIDSVKEMYLRRKKEPKENISEEEEPDENRNSEDQITEYKTILDGTRYRNYSNVETERYEKEDENMHDLDLDQPYIIEPGEFGMEDENALICLKYYADDVLTDEWDELIEDVDETVGLDNLECFKEDDRTDLYVRNDALRADYEINYIPENYSDVVRIDSHQMEDK